MATKEDLNVSIIVKLFGSYRELIGKDKIILKLTEQMTVRDLKRMILELYPVLLTKVQLVNAVNRKIADDATMVNQLDEVAILPPVSGG